MSRVFISYARSDEHWARWVAALLKLLRFEVELDVLSWRVGDDFTDRMNQGLSEADIILAIISQAYFDPARYSSVEGRAAQAMLVSTEHRVVMLNVDGTEVPPLLKSKISIHIHDMPARRATRKFVESMLPLLELEDEFARASEPNYVAIEALAFPGEVDQEAGRTPLRDILIAGIDADIARAAAEATDRLRDMAALESEQLYVDEALHEAKRLGRTYLHTNPILVFREASELRTRIDKELARNRNPDQLRDLHVAMAHVFGIMSYTALDLGRGSDANKLANLSLAHAQRSGEIYIRAWAYGTLSLIARFSGYDALSVDYAMKGLELHVLGLARCRLLSNAAESYANIGNEQRMKDLLAQSEESMDQETPAAAHTLADGIFYFPAARVHFYAASALIHLPSVRTNGEAATQAERAIELFETSGPLVWSYNDILVAKVHLARARAQAGQLDGVLTALEAVLTAPAEYRTSWHAHFLAQFNAVLTSKGLSRSYDGKELSAAISTYLIETAHLIPEESGWSAQSSSN